MSDYCDSSFLVWTPPTPLYTLQLLRYTLISLQKKLRGNPRLQTNSHSRPDLWWLLPSWFGVCPHFATCRAVDLHPCLHSSRPRTVQRASTPMCLSRWDPLEREHPHLRTCSPLGDESQFVGVPHKHLHVLYIYLYIFLTETGFGS